MPYPVAHVMFFVFCVSAVMTYIVVKSFLRKEFTSPDLANLLLLLSVGAIAALFPDITVVYSVIANGSTEHCNLGSVPTHSLLFASLAFVFAVLAGYAAYGRKDKAVYLGIFAESASLSHLLLDDLARNEISYLYPISDRTISIFSYVDGPARTSFVTFLLACYVAILWLSFVIMLALFALDHLGFDLSLRRRDES